MYNVHILLKKIEKKIILARFLKNDKVISKYYFFIQEKQEKFVKYDLQYRCPQQSLF